MVRVIGTSLVVVALAGCGNKDWKQAQAANTGEAYRSFVSANPTSGKVDEALRKAELLDWVTARAADTPEAYLAYVGAHPQGEHVADARGRAEALALTAARAEGRPEPLMAFLVEYPRTSQREAIESEIEDAWHTLALTEGTEAAWGSYLVRYPEGRWADEARRARDDAAWSRTVKGDTRFDYERYLETFENGKYRLDALDWLARLKVRRIQPVLALGKAPVDATARSALALKVRREIDATLSVDLARDFEVLRTVMVDLRGAPAPHPQDAYDTPPETGIVVVLYQEALGQRLEPSGNATDIEATIQVYAPPSRKPVLETTVTATTQLPVTGTTETVLHDSALADFGDQLGSVADSIATFRQERRRR